MPEIIAETIYDILVETCGAFESWRNDFVSIKFGAAQNTGSKVLSISAASFGTQTISGMSLVTANTPPTNASR
jgi:hypothetical protein